VGARGWAHCYGAGEAGAHEVGAGEGLSSAVGGGGEGEGGCGTVGCADGGVAGGVVVVVVVVGYAAAFGIWAVEEGAAVVGAFEAGGGFSVVLRAAVGWGDEAERGSAACC